MTDEQYKMLGGFILAIQLLLIEKGICTQEEFETSLIKANQVLDQVFQEKREEARKEIEEKYPGICKTFLGKALFPGVFDDDLGVKI